MLADGAGDVAQAGVYALMAGMTTANIAEAYHPYLTMAEGLKLAPQTFTRDVTKLSCCAASSAPGTRPEGGAKTRGLE